MEELKRILVNYNMREDLFDSSHRHTFDNLYRNFISNVPDPYL